MSILSRPVSPLVTGTLELAAYTIHYQRMGTGIPLLMLHGFMGDSRDFLPIMERLSDHYACLALDLPGHGQTRVNRDPSSYGMTAVAKAVMALLADLDIAHTGLLGYSMGGRLALYLAIHYPTTFPALILESASPGLAMPAAQAQRRAQDEQLAQRLETEEFAAFVQWWYDQPLLIRNRQHANFPAIYQRRLGNRSQELATVLRQMGTGSQPSLWPDLRDLAMPLLLLVGEEDTKFQEIARKMVTECPQAEWVGIPDSGHTIHLENPEDYVRHLRQFLARVMSSSL